jgi:hypothetical protein
VGWAPNGSGRHIAPTFQNHRKHGLDGVHDMGKTTDGAQGQAWSASGGEHGKRSARKQAG